jgi:hypothetical protein
MRLIPVRDAHEFYFEIDNSDCGREHAKTFGVENRDWPIRNRKSKTCPELAKRVEWIENVVVPVVQRIERRFPKGKTAFLQESPNEVRSTQLAVFEVVH